MVLMCKLFQLLWWIVVLLLLAIGETTPKRHVSIFLKQFYLYFYNKTQLEQFFNFIDPLIMNNMGLASLELTD